jgi:hypothetical protein
MEYFVVCQVQIPGAWGCWQGMRFYKGEGLFLPVRAFGFMS